MLALLAGAPDRAVCILGRMKPRRFLDFARENGIAGDLVALAQDQGGGVSAVFDPILAELIESARKQRAINRAVVAHLHEVAEIFAARGIEWIVLKGPHLSLRYYGSLDQRRMGDLDLLVRRRDLRAASAALVAAGYASRTGAPLGLAALRFVHHVEHEKDGVPVDLHHQIRVHPTFRFDEEAMWRTAGSLDLGARTVRVLSDEYVLVTLLLSIHNDVGLGTADLHPFFDLDRVLARAGATASTGKSSSPPAAASAPTPSPPTCSRSTSCYGRRRAPSRAPRELEARRSELVTEPDRRAYVELIQGASLAVKKRWAFAQLATSLPAATLWWLVGLPVHALVYRRIFFRNFGQRLALRRKARAERRARPPNVVHAPRPTAPGPPGGPARRFRGRRRRAADEDLRPMRLGSLTLELRCDRTFAPDTLEELFRLEGTRDDAARRGARATSAFTSSTPRSKSYTAWCRHRSAGRAARSRRHLRGAPPGGVGDRRAAAHSGAGRGPASIAAGLGGIRDAGHRDHARSDAGAQPDDRLLPHAVRAGPSPSARRRGRARRHTSLFLGGKGAGKSTLCLALARAGATVLGEDHVLVRRAATAWSGGFVVSGCDANMRLTAQTEEALLPQPPNGRKAWFGGVLKREFDLR